MSDHGTDPKTRGALIDEQLAALKEIWTKDVAEFHGKFVDFDPIWSWPKPVQKPHPPIYIGGESPAALKRLLRFGDGWLPRGGVPVAEILRTREWLAERGRPDVPFTVFGAGTDPGMLAGYVDARVERVTFMLETEPEAETLRRLDELAAVAEDYR
jgi:alkanesulfonate monooxygenase SsuD/methylene tetrahydromethanopterin reductase-like flavin-dependent oxidoreductase (luciferase family)